MSLIYRAIWQDLADGIHERGRKEFAWWVNLRNPAQRSLEVGIEETLAGATTLVRAGSDASGSIQRCSVHVDDGATRITTTLITTSTSKPIGSIWVDQERVSGDAFAPFQVHAPELSVRLIATGRDPRRGPIRLQPKPTALHPDQVPEFVETLSDPRRDLPIVVLSTGPELSALRCLETGRYAARVLAGSAAVYLIDAGRSVLDELVGSDLGVVPGGARVYLPKFSLDDPEPGRHRTLAPERIRRDPNAAAHTIVQLLAPATAAQRAPMEYPELRRLLHGSPSIDVGDDTSLRMQVQGLEDSIVAAESRIEDLEAKLAESENRVLDLVSDLGDSEARVNEATDKLVALLVSGKIDNPTDQAVRGSSINCCSDALRAAVEHLDGIVFHDSAAVELEQLDRSLEARSWGQISWRAFKALNAFAGDRAFRLGFWEWCQAGRSPLAWPASSKTLAMSESQSVMRIEALRSKRIFPVDPNVDPSGKIVMQAHLKVGKGGGPLIPRIYFHDDRHGATAKIHIGFFGPHYLIPTSSFR